MVSAYDRWGLRHCANDTRSLLKKFRDVRFVNDQRGRDRQRVAGNADDEVLVLERPLHGLITALPDGIRPRGEIDASRKPDGAHVEHVRQAFQRHRRVGVERF